jgi:hypothetical protein
MSSKTSIGDAKAALIQSAWKILKFETKSSIALSSLSENDYRRVFDFIRKSKIANLPTSDTTQYGRLLRVLFQKLSEEEDLNLLAQLSYLPFTSGFDADKGNLDQILLDLVHFAQYAAEINSSVNYLLLIKLILCIFENQSFISSCVIPMEETIPIGLSQCCTLAPIDIKKINDKMNNLEHIKLFQSQIRPFPCNGNISKCSHTEISGKVSGFVSNFNLVQCDYPLAYFEANIKLRYGNAKGLKIGWGKILMQFSNQSTLGSGDDSWVLDLHLKRFFS